MYIRTKTTPNSPRRSVQIVESIRENGKPRQRILRHMGIAENDEQLIELKALAASEIARLEAEAAQIQPELFSSEDMLPKSSKGRMKTARVFPEKIENIPVPADVQLNMLLETDRQVVGIHDVYGQVFDDLGLSSILPKASPLQREHFRNLVLARISCPASKNATSRLLADDFGMNQTSAQSYKVMDKIDDNVIESLQKSAYFNAKLLIGESLRVMFYDCTTLYFESFVEEGIDELDAEECGLDKVGYRSKGMSKDHKSQETQIVLALLVSQEGLPIAYEVFPGKTAEIRTLVPVLQKIKVRFELDQIIFVADRGLFSEENLCELDANNIEFAVGARIKNMAKTKKIEILQSDAYQEIKGEDHDQHCLKAATFEHKGRRLVVSYSSKRAKKDKGDREKLIEKLKRKLKISKKPKSFVSYRSKLIKQEDEAELLLDEDAVAEVAKFDGYSGIITNSTQDVAVILEHYHGLWAVEESFRISKHDLKMRPIYHQKTDRIKAHIAICFAALMCVRHLTYRCAIQYTKLSPAVIRDELMRTEISVLTHIKTHKKYAMPSKIRVKAQKLYMIVGKKLKNTPYCID
jgi:transposase